MFIGILYPILSGMKNVEVCVVILHLDYCYTEYHEDQGGVHSCGKSLGKHPTTIR